MVYSPDAVTMSPMHRRRRHKSVSIKNYLPANHRRCIGDALQAPSDYMETSPKACLSILEFFWF